MSGIAAASWPLADELAMYRRTGTDRIGLQAAKLAALGWDDAEALVRGGGLPVEYLVHAFTADPDDERRWSRQVPALVAAVESAARLDAPTVYLVTGPSGRLPWEEAADRFTARMRPAVERAGELGIALAIENTHQVRADLSFVHSVRDAAEVARRLDAGLCVDLYCCAQERGLAATLRAELDRIRLVQVSDFRSGTNAFPNRWVPGDGDLPMAELLADVLAAGYRGTVDIELVGPAIEAEGPEPALTRAVAWTRDRLPAR
ncbi:sugar phosphate isomerase/epimerase family protein [Blastococcus sp. SYSU D00820]